MCRYDEENLANKKTIMAKAEKSFSQNVRRYNKISKLETVFTNFSASSDPETIAKALILAKHLLKAKDKVVANSIELSNELLSEISNNWQQVADLTSDFEIRNNKGAEATKEKFRHLTDIAIYLVNDYAIAKPHHLNNQKCARGVTGPLIKALIKHFNNEKEQEKACLIDIPTEKTARKHISLAFKALGFPEYSKPRRKLGLSDATPLR